jgi:hypothetical protein
MDVAPYWSAASQRYAAGDYLKAIGELDHLLEGPNDYTARALPLSLVLTSGVASGYMDLADCYASGARANKPKAQAFRRKASVYRALANHMVLQFAERAGKIEHLIGNPVQLAFGPPKGNPSEPALLSQIANGAELAQVDEDEAQALALDRGVLMSAAGAVGAPANFVKAISMLQRGEVLAQRAVFVKAMSDLLERESKLYARDKLDDAAKMDMLRQLAKSVVTNAPGTQSASVLPIGKL